MSTADVGRLRSIAKTVRQLPSFYQVPGSIASHYFLIVDKGAAFIREAESLGAFQGDSIYGRVGEKLAHPSCHLDEMIPIAARKVPGWKLTVWSAVVDTLAPELTRIRSQSIVTDANGNYSMRFDTSEEEAEIVARAIEAEADRMEAQIKADKGSVKQGEGTMGRRAKKTGKKAKGGRKPDPQIARRNRGIFGMLEKGKSVNDICDRYDVSPGTVYRLKSDAKKQKS